MIVNPNQSLPSFKDYRVRNDAVMAPDRGFTKQLKTLDKDFEVVWDWASEKWEIWKFPKDKEPFHVTTIQTKNKKYRELGADILLRLQQFDNFSGKQIADYLEAVEDQHRRRRLKDFKNKIESIAFETFNYAQGILQIQVPKKFKIAEAVKNV